MLLALPLLTLISAPATATGYSADIELVRPTFSPGSFAGVDTPTLGRPGTVRAGVFLQYERDPLLLYQLEREAGSVVHNRLMGHLGASVDFNKRFSARFTLPIGGQWGTEVPGLGADVGGVGDMSLGVRMHVVELGPVNVGGRLDILLPFGTPNAYLGETGLRGVVGVLTEVGLGPLALVGDFSVVGRAPVATEQDFDLSSELALNGGIRLDLWPDHFALGAGVVSRSGLANFLGGGAETPVELVAGVQIQALREWRLDLGLGRGLAPGYGTTQLRALAGLTWQRTPPLAPSIEPSTPTRMRITEAPDLPLIVDIEVEQVEISPIPLWKPDELARVEETQIVIRDPIQFELATANILPESLPTLHAIAKLLAEHSEIAHLVIEGHASEEGSFPYNYDLSIRRSLAIFQELVLAGTYPGRLSCRGMGEVEPVTLGSSENALAPNRRVIFHIVRRLKPGETPPPMRTEMQLPWDGTPATFTPPPPLPLPAPPVAAPVKPPGPEADYPTDLRLFQEREDDTEPEKDK